MKRIVLLTLALMLTISMALGVLTACKSDVAVKSEGACEYFETREVDPKFARYVKITVKDYGEIVLLLDELTAPVTVKNFIKLVNEGFYNGLTFHRVMNNFMIQGGDPNADGSGGSSEKIYGEFYENGYPFNDISHIEGVISMARSGNNMNSASSQFFICNANSTFLDDKYAAFGYVICGTSIVDSITENTVEYANSTTGTIADKSKQAVIESIVVITEAEALEFVENSK